ncbi:c-type cytochrome domain-containing protein [Blastopirellula marina]|uniref:Cytochrome c domain-containing protein n=1 Tax=Blastopirellula marina TaxID=124 RepID=A0A2S8F7Z5_9BACT|nr:c-type cytochrome domain-containing protein [Blastopirellula marina]PQO28273.1 hypothetical protein C5Y98_25595 [Blastopirellula marina]PTL41813.1 hypothetical protein C5Y97_25610 [Blastopirellula marina]
MFRPLAAATLVVLLTASMAVPALAAPTPEQREQLKTLKVDIRKASNFLKRGLVPESVTLIRDVQTRMKTLDAAQDEEIAAELKELAELLAVSHGLLELEGYTLQPLLGHVNSPAAEMAMPAAPGTPPAATPPAPLPTTFPTANLSFTKHVAPILIARCGNCHVTGSRGGFNAGTFEALMTGPPEGRVIFPNDDIGSRLIETIESGDMPRGGQQVRAPELAALKTWIKEGAKFDGTDPKAPINQASASPAPAPMEMMRLEVVNASGNEKVSFSLDVAGILASRCTNCHTGQNPGGNLRMDSFAQFIRGGDSGAPLMPGKPQESMLVRLLKASGNERMPRNGPPLTADQIAKIETWIREGGKFDGTSAQNESMLRLNQVALAKKATHEELAKLRATSSEQMWQLSMPDVKTAKIDTPLFLAYGTMGDDLLKEYVAEAEKAADKVRSLLKVPSASPLVKGKLTLYFFKQRYDYAEFGNMIEQRELPGDWKGHYRFDITDAYGAIQAPSDGNYDMNVLLGQLIGSSHVASLGNGTVPAWFSEGVGRVVAYRMNKSDPRVQSWDSQIGSAVASMGKPDDFVNNRLSPEQNGIVSFGFMKAAMARSNQFDALMNALRKGTDFDQAFQSAFGGTPSQVATAWVASGRR